MPRHQRTAREIAEQTAQRILTQIGRKVNRWEMAAADKDKVGMLLNQLSEEEYEFLQKQQKIETKGEQTDAEIAQLKDMDTEKMDEVFRKLMEEDNRTN